MRKVALTVLLAGVLAFTGGGVVAAQPGHQDGKDRFPEVIALPDGFRPEGISIGRGTSFYVGSVAGGAIYRGDVKTGKGAILVEAADTPGASIGTEVDKRNRLWVAGGGTGTGVVYDAKSGEVLRSYQFVANPAPNQTFVNDVVVTRDAAYFTDSINQVLYVVPIGRGGRLGDFKTLPLTGDLAYLPGFNVNGIEASPDGATLLIVQSNTGLLFKVSAKTGKTRQVDLGGATLINGDGLLLQGRSILYAVQNQLNQIAVVKLNRSYTSGKVLDPILNENFDIPTTVAPFGKYLYAVNARFGIPDPDTAEYSVVRVDAFRGR